MRAAAALPKVIGAGGSLLIAAVFARPLPVPVIKRFTEPARRQNASKCHQQGNDKRCPQDHGFTMMVFPFALAADEPLALRRHRRLKTIPSRLLGPGRARSCDRMLCTRR